MAESGADFGLVDGIGAEAIGRPGQRTFRLIASSGGVSGSLWLEEEYLAALGTALQLAIVRLGRPAAREQPARLLGGDDLPSSPVVEFQCGQLRMEYDEGRQEFVVYAYPVEAPGDEASSWRGRMTVP